MVASPPYVGADAVNVYEGRGPHLITRPDGGDKFGTLTLVASRRTWLVLPGDRTGEDEPEFPPDDSVTDGSGPMVLDDDGDWGFKSWTWHAHERLTAWGSAGNAVLLAVWSS